jgi:hypothetical protein
VNIRDASDKGFDPSSFDDVRELVRTWTEERSLTASQIVNGLRARGVAVRATSSGRHVIVEAPCRPGGPADGKLFIAPVADAPVAERRHRVIRPPGHALHRVAGLFSKRTRERVLDPIIADMQLEYCEALAEERPRRLKLWWVQLRAWVAFAEAIILRTVVGRIINGLSKIV